MQKRVKSVDYFHVKACDYLVVVRWNLEMPSHCEPVSKFCLGVQVIDVHASKTELR